MSPCTEPIYTERSASVNLTVENVSCSLSLRFGFWRFDLFDRGENYNSRRERNMKIWLVILSKHGDFPCRLCRICSGRVLFWCNDTAVNHLHWWHGAVMVCLYVAGLFPYLEASSWSAPLFWVDSIIFVLFIYLFIQCTLFLWFVEPGDILF